MKALTDAQRDLAATHARSARHQESRYAKRFPRMDPDDIAEACDMALLHAAVTFDKAGRWSFGTYLKWQAKRHVDEIVRRKRPKGYRLNGLKPEDAPKTVAGEFDEQAGRAPTEAVSPEDRERTDLILIELDRLPANEREAVRRYYGIGCDPQGDPETAAAAGITRQSVSGARKRALAKLAASDVLRSLAA